jgi:hypothetical protein
MLTLRSSGLSITSPGRDQSTLTLHITGTFVAALRAARGSGNAWAVWNGIVGDEDLANAIASSSARRFASSGVTRDRAKLLLLNN